MKVVCLGGWAHCSSCDAYPFEFMRVRGCKDDEGDKGDLIKIQIRGYRMSECTSIANHDEAMGLLQYASGLDMVDILHARLNIIVPNYTRKPQSEQ